MLCSSRETKMNLWSGQKGGSCHLTQLNVRWFTWGLQIMSTSTWSHRARGDHWGERPWNSYRYISVIPCSGSLSSEEGLPHSRYHTTHLPEPGWDHSTTAFQVNGEATTWIWEVCVGSCVLWWPRQSWTSAKMGRKNGCLCQTSAISNKTGGTEASKHAL